jgi:hypothetical protein
MVTLFVFYIHTIAAVSIFTKRWQESGWGDGILGVGFLALIFSVGWSISTFLLKLIIDEKGFGIWLDRDALSLLLLTVMEAIFFYAQMKRKQNKIAV